MTELFVLGRTGVNDQRRKAPTGGRTNGRKVEVNFNDRNGHDQVHVNQTIKGDHENLIVKGYIQSMPRVHQQFQYAVVWQFDFVVAQMIDGPFRENAAIATNVASNGNAMWQGLLANARSIGLSTVSAKENSASLAYAVAHSATLDNPTPPGGTAANRFANSSNSNSSSGNGSSGGSSSGGSGSGSSDGDPTSTMKGLVTYARAHCPGVEESCLKYVQDYLDGYGHYGANFPRYEYAWNFAVGGSQGRGADAIGNQYGLKRLGTGNPYDAPAGAIVVVPHPAPGTFLAGPNPGEAGDISIATGDGHFINDHLTESYGGSSSAWAAAGYNAHIYVPTNYSGS